MYIFGVCTTHMHDAGTHVRTLSVCLSVCMYVRMDACIDVRMHACMCVCVIKSVGVCVCVRMFLCACIHVVGHADSSHVQVSGIGKHGEMQICTYADR